MTDCELCGTPMRFVRDQPHYPKGPEPYVPGQRPSTYGPEVEIHRVWECPNRHRWLQTPQGMRPETVACMEQP